MPTIALADDHILLRNGLSSLIETLGHTVLFQADHGAQLIEKLEAGMQPDLILLDINMPVMDGYQTAELLRIKYPLIRILALSMYDHETAIIRMLKAGAKGYILKDCEPQELQLAINTVYNGDFHHSKMVSGKLINAILHSREQNVLSKQPERLNDREIEFLKYTCSEMTYREIAEKMNLSPRTIDGYRDSLFEKLNLKTRTGLVVYAIKNGYYIV
ncbi:MAG: response regulator transcription factor [Chitinophagaceae bacterium]